MFDSFILFLSRFSKTVMRIFAVAIFVTICMFFAGCDNNAQKTSGEPNGSEAKPASTNAIASAQRSPISNAQFVNDQLCSECHAEIFKTYQHVAMSQSFYDFDSEKTVEDFESNHYYHAPSDNHYEMNVLDGELQMTRYKKRDDGTKAYANTVTAQYVVGSGNHVRTYIHRNETGEMFQLPVVWYSQGQHWGMAPGYDRPDHLDFGRPITRHCMFCHNAYPEFEAGSDHFGMPHLFPEKMPQGIGCQRCHGPGSEHIRLANELDSDGPGELKKVLESIVNTAKLSPQLQDDACNQCHLQPSSQRSSIVECFGKGSYSYIVGQPLEQHLVHFEFDRDNVGSDHFEINHHPYRLQQSKCFMDAENGIRCTHCHDPHSRVTESERASHYRQKCFSCHSSNECKDKENGRLPDANCVSCHMPERRTSDVVHVTMTDHKIGIYKNREQLLNSRTEIDVPIDTPIRPYGSSKQAHDPQTKKAYELFSRALDDDSSSLKSLCQLVESESDKETLKLQLIQNLLQHKQFQQAEQLTKSVSEETEQLSAFQTNAGVAALGSKQIEESTDRLTKATSLDPKNANAWYNLGVSYARANRTHEAIQCLETAIQLRPTYTKPMLKLGSVYALADEFKKASAQFEKALKIDVRNIEAYKKLSATKRRLNEWEQAIQLLQDATTIAKQSDTLKLELALALLEPENLNHRNDEQVLAIANALESSNQTNADTILVKAMALLRLERPKEALETIATILVLAKRQPEAGLLIAIAQKRLQSNDAAKQNFTGAKRAIENKSIDRLGRIILQLANSEFVDLEQND